MASISLKDGEQARMEITQAQENEISKLYHQVYLDYKKQMAALPLHGEGTVSQSLQKTYLNKLTKQLKAAYQSLGEGLEKQIAKGMGDTAQAVVSSNDQWLKKAGLKVEGAYSYVPQDIVSLLSTGKLYGDGWTLSKAIWGESQKHADDINKIVAAGVAGNKSAYDIAKDLEKYVNPSAKKEWDWSKVYPGTSKKVDYNAQRLARTMVSHAYQQSLLASTKHNPFVTGYRWRSAHTHRTCELCNERDGQVYSANDLPLDHPNGLCTFLAELSGSLTDIADRLGDWANGADDPALDEWAKSMYPPQKGYQFTELQQKWLGAAGFSPTNMPQNFKAFANELTFAQQTELLKLAGTDWNNPHPYQAMEKWYKANLLGPFTTGGAYSPAKAVKQAMKAETTKVPGGITPAQIRKLLQENDLRELAHDAQPWWESLTKREQEGIRTYTGSAYRSMNTALRTGNVVGSHYESQIKAAAKGLHKYKTPSDSVVRRGSSLDSLGSMLGVGDSHTRTWYLTHREEFIHSMAEDKGFLSTSPAPHGGFGGQVEYRIFVPQGSPAPYIDHYSRHRGEEETLLPPGSQHRVIDLLEEDGKLVAYLELTGFSK